jgi:hypothetical protein
MSRFFLLLLLSLPVWSFGQSIDSIRLRIDSLTRLNASRYDSTSQRVNNKIDSVQGTLNNLLNPDLNKLSSRIQRKRTKEDTLRAVQQLDSTKAKLTQQIDSLKQLNLPTESLTRKMDSLKQYSPEQYLQKLEARANNLENKINQPVNKLEDKLNEKLSLMNKEGGAGANLPGNANLPGAELNTDLQTNLDLPATDLKVGNPLGELDNPLKDELSEANELKGKIAEVKDVPQQQIDKLKSVEQVQVAQDKLGQANELTDKAQAYSSDVKNIAQGNLEEVKELPNGLEQQALKLDEVQELQKQSGELGKMQEMAGKGNDPEAMKALAKDHAMTYAKDHFAGKQEVLKAAMDKMANLKTKYASLDSLSNIPKYKPNQMKGKSFIERLVPGLTFQVQKSANTLIDYSAVLGYRINGRVTAGAGWNERIGLAKKLKFTTSDRIYGPRAFVDVMVFKGFSARVEGEKMRTDVPPTLVSYYDERGKAWIWSAFVGIKKQYNFTRSVKGNFQFLYNFYDDHDSSPYTERFNVRFGFEFPLRKVKKSHNPVQSN